MPRLFEIAAFAAALLAASAAAAPAPVDFAREVKPILSDNCYHCHGPDEATRKGGLRLDTREGIVRSKSGKPPVVPGQSARSEVVRRILSADPDVQMPPPDSHRTLSAAQKATLRRWVDEGAKWGTHWAFLPMSRATPPASQTSIDSFIRARLAREKLPPAPEADRDRLLRRVTFDLTGLPPTPAEMDAFLADRSPRAYEAVLDRLLASPAHGERMAAEWLDIARFSDTHGYQADRFRAMWPYRDWVIKAFNENLPFDQFVTWQIAGDLLPDASKEQRLATAFNRLHAQNEEGGIVEEEFRVAYVVDRVNTFGTAFLGLTLECTRCHDHKYDPLTQRDFYSLFAFFQNVDESGQTTFFTDAMPVPTLLLPTAEQDEKLAELRAIIQEKESALAFLRETARAPFVEWQKTNTAAPVTAPVAHFPLEGLVSKQLTNLANPKLPGAPHESPEFIAGKTGRAALLDGDDGFVFKDVGDFTRSDDFSFGIWIRPREHATRQIVFHHSKAPIDAGSRGYDMLIEEGRVAFGLHHMWPGNSLKVHTRTTVPTNEWTHVLITYDGSSRAAGVVIYVNGKSETLEVIRDGLWKDITYGGKEPSLAIGHRFREVGFKGGAVDEFKVYDRELSAIEARAEAHGGTAKSIEAEQFEYFFSVVHEPSKTARAALRTARREHAKFINPIPEAMVMHEMPQPKPAFILKRGSYDAHGDPVTAGTPAVLPPFPAAAPRNRLGLARWLLDPEHPLMARVTVNRAWQMLFGRGLVESSENLGSQGDLPTHPELLDWLARDFIAGGWDHKRLLRQIVLSATYRQSSLASASLLARDPQNLLLARGPAQRLTAEMLRDHALAASGLLAAKIGGPSVKPYQPEAIWDVASGSPKYERGKGDDLHRRSLYTYNKRTVPPPAMALFDAADRSYCNTRRQTTSTPLQALALLNDVQMTEAARFIGQRMLREGGETLDERISWTFRLVTGRRPAAQEATVLRRLFIEQHLHFITDAEAAKQLLSAGDKKSDASLPAADRAAATVLATALLNHDEAVMRR